MRIILGFITYFLIATSTFAATQLEMNADCETLLNQGQIQLAEKVCNDALLNAEKAAGGSVFAGDVYVKALENQGRLYEMAAVWPKSESAYAKALELKSKLVRKKLLKPISSRPRQYHL